jgi:hypothetical protein
VVAIVTLIIGLAIIATILSERAKTVDVIKALSGGLASDIGAAEAPVTGSAPITGI